MQKRAFPRARERTPESADRRSARPRVLLAVGDCARAIARRKGRVQPSRMKLLAGLSSGWYAALITPDVSAANDIPGSQTGSQRPPT
jgi:hypothetical protein